MRHIDRHNGATRAARQLIDGLGLARAGAAVEQARKALAETLLLHPLVDFAVFLLREERRQFHHLLLDFGGIEHLLGGDVGRMAQIGDSDIAGLEIELAQQVTLGRTGEAVGRGVGDAVFTKVFNEFLLHQWMVTTLQRTARLAETALAGEELAQFAAADAVIVLIDTEVDEEEKNHPVVSSEVECAKALDKLQLGIGVDKVLEFLTHLIEGGGIINQVVENAVHRLEEIKHI